MGMHIWLLEKGFLAAVTATLGTARGGSGRQVRNETVPAVLVHCELSKPRKKRGKGQA